MVPELLELYARRIEGFVAVLGPKPKVRVVLLLRELGITEEGAEAVIAHAITTGLVQVDPADAGILRAVQHGRQRGDR